MLGAVEVGKNERYLIIPQAGAVAARRLAGGGKHVQQLIVQHGVKEDAGFGRKFLIEFFTLGQNGIGIAAGGGVAGTEHQGIIGKAHGVLFAQALGLLTVDAVRQRHQILDHGGTELFYIRFGIAVAAHAVVAQGGVTLVPQLFAHLIPQVGQLVINIIQLFLVVLIPLALGFPGGQAAGIVRVILERAQLGQSVHPAFKRDLCAGQQLAILLGQLVFLLQFLHDIGRECLALNFGVHKHQVAVFFGKVFAVGACQHGGGPGILPLLDLRHGAVGKFHLFIIELIPRINGMAHAGQGEQGIHMLVQHLLLQKSGAGSGIVGGVLQTLGQCGKLFFQGAHVRALIGHFGKFHGFVLSLFYSFVRDLGTLYHGAKNKTSPKKAGLP